MDLNSSSFEPPRFVAEMISRVPSKTLLPLNFLGGCIVLMKLICSYRTASPFLFLEQLLGVLSTLKKIFSTFYI